MQFTFTPINLGYDIPANTVPKPLNKTFKFDEKSLSLSDSDSIIQQLVKNPINIGCEQRQQVGGLKNDDCYDNVIVVNKTFGNMYISK